MQWKDIYCLMSCGLTEDEAMATIVRGSFSIDIRGSGNGPEGIYMLDCAPLKHDVLYSHDINFTSNFRLYILVQ